MKECWQIRVFMENFFEPLPNDLQVLIMTMIKFLPKEPKFRIGMVVKLEAKETDRIRSVMRHLPSYAGPLDEYPRMYS